MGKKLRNVMLHMIGTVMTVSLMFGNALCVFAEETKSEETATAVSDAEMTPNSEKLVSQKAPEVGLKNVTLNNTDVLNNLVGVTRLFYNGEFSGKFVVNTEPYLEIYSADNIESEVAGKIYPASGGVVEEWGPEWTKVSSGNVTGYISTKDISIGYDAEKLAKEIGHHKVTVTADSLNIRQEANTDSEVLTTAIQSESFPVVETGEEWTRIDYGSGEGFVASEYVEESIELDEAISIAEEEAAAMEEMAASPAETETNEETSDAKNSGKSAESVPASSPVSVGSDEAYLLACMVYVESGAESYEGQLAVANVILNRVRDPRFDNTIAGVIYAPGQFPGAHNGVLDNVLASGPSESCIRAANEALAGVNNIGAYYYFNGYVDTSSVSEYLVIGGHTFYNY
ncbi:cell wall hydrolase [Frisingicoccus caecimuris]|uniref:SH3 domain-containing protein n=1 Tax=Frisingicoccus caecimuris TaxID=1796636 RepID=A0A4R2LE27_9FIRM|nr:cell wall hydrolase [Frisingicoccus caecimuris]MCR1918700.1 cell wall hydrolase [Frisingicoccus caecimuris]TCO86332.1 SH3 domain-containing protein [Frisingicoccus caecimuris]